MVGFGSTGKHLMCGGPQTLTYRDSGVDIAAGNRLVTRIAALARSTDRPGVTGSIGGFGGLFDPSAAGYRDPLLVAATDGVGTKLKVAIEAGRHDTVGIDLVAMCVNDLVVQGAEPLFFLDYFATGRLSEDVAATVVAGIAAGCRAAGAALIGGETAEMPGLYAGGDFDLAGFAVGAVERGGALPRAGIKAGDRILGLASSGLHSNGFSLVRRILEQSGLPLSGTAPFGSGRDFAGELLMPTRIYAAPCLAAIRETGAVNALAHITGGGLVENVPRILPPGLAACIDLGAVRVPPVFGWLARSGPVDEAEMLRTFNCGIGMAAIIDSSDADRVAAAFEAAGETVSDIGEIVPRVGPAITFRGNLDLGEG